MNTTEMPLLDRTVGELVAQRLPYARVFQSLQIDFCCQGNQTLREACAKRKLSPEVVLAQLETAMKATSEPEMNPALLPAHELAQYIVDHPHAFLRRELPRLLELADLVARVHGDSHPSLSEVAQILHSLSDELMIHIVKEEEELFPVVAPLSKLTEAEVKRAVRLMMEDHDEAGAALKRLRELTNDFQAPADGCHSYRSLFSGLAALEEDLHRHIHLENSVLFPMAQKLVDARESL